MKQRDILLILIPTFLLVILWVIFNIYHNSIESTVSKTVTSEVIPINPDFDFQTIESLKKREIVQSLYEIKPSNSSSPIPTGVETSSSSAIQEPTITQQPEPSPTITAP